MASALATMIQMKKEEQNIAESAAQNEFLTSRLKRLERNILVRPLRDPKRSIRVNFCIL